MTGAEVLAALVAAQAGSQDAWRRLFDGCLRFSRFCAWRAGVSPAGDVDDCVMDGWVRFLCARRKVGDFASGEQVLSYLALCIRSAAIDASRRTERKAVIVDKPTSAEQEGADIEGLALARLEAQALWSALSGSERRAALEIYAGFAPAELATSERPATAIYEERRALRLRARRWKDKQP